MRKTGEKCKCEECGLVVVVEDACGCSECNLVCCEAPNLSETAKPEARK